MCSQSNCVILEMDDDTQTQTLSKSTIPARCILVCSHNWVLFFLSQKPETERKGRRFFYFTAEQLWVTESRRNDSLQGRGGEVVLSPLHQKLPSELGRKKGETQRGGRERRGKKEGGKSQVKVTPALKIWNHLELFTTNKLWTLFSQPSEETIYLNLQ